MPGAAAAAAPSGLKTDDVAVVGNTHISKTDYDLLIAQAKQSLGKTFPKQGTAEYEALKSKAVTVLLQQAERVRERVDGRASPSPTSRSRRG